MSQPKKIDSLSDESVAELVQDELLEMGEGDPEKGVEKSEADLISVPIDTIPINLPLPCSLYIKVAGRFPLFRKQGEKLTSKRLVDLSRKGAVALFVHSAVWRVFLTTLEKNVVPPGSPPDVMASHMRGLLVAYGIELERKIKEPKRPLFDKLQVLSESLAAAICRDPSMAMHLLRKSADPQAYFVNHAVNAAVYSTVIGVKLNLSWDELRMLTYAALLHDIGNLYLPKELLYKKSNITPEEMEEIRTHARRGAELLQSMGATPSVVLAALQHHERMDGEGYPSELSGEKIHLFARIVAIADTYDALTSNKPYEAAMTPADAILKMKSLTGKFDPNIIGTVTG